MDAILTQNTIDINAQLRKCLFSQNKRSGELNQYQVDSFKKLVADIINTMISSDVPAIEAELKMAVALKGRASELILSLSKYVPFSKTDKRKEYLSNLISLHLEIEESLFKKHF